MKKKDTTPEDASAWASAPGGRITPQEVQQKEFRVARFGAGYRMREVDEFLDQVTDAMSALVAENERLLQGSASGSPASTRPSTAPAAPSVADEAGRAAVDAFLRREKGFLQDLGGLVQAHAEELRSMVRDVRRDIAAPAAAAPSTASVPPVAGAPVKESPVEPPAVATEAAPAPDEAPDEAPEPSPDLPEVADEPQDEIEDETQEDDPEASGGPPTTTGVVAEEPIRLDEPEPARSGRSEEEEEGSLRELFWGEE